MIEHISGQKWDLTEEQIERIGAAVPDPRIAADLLVACFAKAQKELLEKKPQIIASHPTSEDIDNLAAALVHHKAREIGVSLENPTKQNLVQLVDELSLQSAAWGTPQEVIEHNVKLMKKIIARLPG